MEARNVSKRMTCVRTSFIGICNVSFSQTSGQEGNAHFLQVPGQVKVYTGVQQDECTEAGLWTRKQSY